jgi:antitoxin ParD1/3/4
MGLTNDLTVQLSEEEFEFVRSKVRNGEFASEAEVVRESLETFRQRSEEVERWEREVVVPAYDHFMADPTSAVSYEKVQDRLAAKRLQRLKAN